jgi:outer membrane protein assembly factor BamB
MAARSLAALAVVALVTFGLRADDWPQWRGPQRDGISREKDLLTEWPDGGPQKLWSVAGLGQGFSTLAVIGNRIYTTGVVDGAGKLIAIQDDGKLLGKSSYGSDSVEGGGYPGSRSTPTIADGRIFVMSGTGVLTCFDEKSGQQQWQVDTFKEFGGRQLHWNVAESVLVDGKRVICTPGGPEALVVALDVATGKPVWTTKGLDCKSAYCSPILVTHKGQRMILTMVEFGAVGIDADNGHLLWKSAHKNKYAVHAASPVYSDGRVVFSSGYGQGTEMLKIATDGKSVEPGWQQKALDNHHGAIILQGGDLYGTNDRGLISLDAGTGKENWIEAKAGKGSITMADGLIYAYSEKGQVSLLKPGPTGATLKGSFKVTEGSNQHWAHPVVANGRLYIRHGDVLMAYDIRKR